jgi:hypothetical protein
MSKTRQMSRRRLLETQVLNLIAIAALRVRPPLRAKRIVDRVARVFGSFEDRAEAEAIAARLEPSGSCLSRALAVAARLPGAEVVLLAGRPDAFWAHAMVEHEGTPLGGETKAPDYEIARL